MWAIFIRSLDEDSSNLRKGKQTEPFFAGANGNRTRVLRQAQDDTRPSLGELVVVRVKSQAWNQHALR